MEERWSSSLASLVYVYSLISDQLAITIIIMFCGGSRRVLVLSPSIKSLRVHCRTIEPHCCIYARAYKGLPFIWITGACVVARHRPSHGTATKEPIGFAAAYNNSKTAYRVMINLVQ